MSARALEHEKERLICESVRNRPSLLELHYTVIHLMEESAWEDVVWNVEIPAETVDRLNITLRSSQIARG